MVSVPVKRKRQLPAFWLVLWLVFSLSGMAQNKSIPDDFCISPEEQQLFDKLNGLLESYGEKPLKMSVSLTYVARLHVTDLQNNHPDTSICNLSSWSDKGPWTACCYNPYVPKQDCMWDKPKELTTYPFRGYELVSYFGDRFNADSVVRLWSSSKESLDMLLANGHFSKKTWVCMGVAMNDHYVSVWFGQRPDRAGKARLCDTASAVAAVPVANTPSEESRYFLVVASFDDPRDAKEAVRRYKKSGYKNAGVVVSDQKNRVYLDSFTDLKEAMYAKKQLPYEFSEAWVYKK